MSSSLSALLASPFFFSRPTDRFSSSILMTRRLPDICVNARHASHRAILCAVCALLLSIAAPAAQAEELHSYLDEGVLILSNVAPAKSRRSSVRVRTVGGITRLTLRETTRISAARRRGVPEAYRALLEEACAHHGVPFELALAVMEVESAFDPNALSKAGAQGLMQLMPATAEDMGVEDAFDPRQNVFGGVRYLRRLTDLFGDDLDRVLAAYNAGPAAVLRADGVPNYPETKAYLARVLSLIEHYKTKPQAAAAASASHGQGER
ncbi:MAG: lytic transglycosylase domain-containing protein [Myxococcales bacterium]|nr:lytic transglycosylase domain-containing protein [Myxococcales bacterium]